MVVWHTSAEHDRSRTPRRHQRPSRDVLAGPAGAATATGWISRSESALNSGLLRRPVGYGLAFCYSVAVPRNSLLS
jgi:hypothetical protein